MSWKYFNIEFGAINSTYDGKLHRVIRTLLNGFSPLFSSLHSPET